MQFVVDPEKRIPVICDTDVVVVGSGPAGLAAAIAAARNGVKVLLVERYGCLGGTATVGLCGDFCGVDHLIQGGIFKEFYDRLLTENSLIEGWMAPFDPEIFKYIAQEMIEESGVRLLLHSFVSDVLKEGNSVKGLIVENKTGRQAVLGRVVIDTTGDADVAYKAGVSFMKGDGETGKTHALTTLFRMANVNIDKVKKAKQVKWGEPHPTFAIIPKEIITQAKKDGKIDITHEDILWWILPRPGQILVNSVHVIHVDPTNVIDLTYAEINARKQIRSIVKYLRENVDGFESSYLLDSSFSIGIRESRRIVGEHILTKDDMLRSKKFADSIAMANWYVDVHGPEEQHTVIRNISPYYVPYRCLLPKDIENLLVAGRCISCDFFVQSSIRSMPCCFATGQAAGTAAALAVKGKISPKNINVKTLQETLIKQGAKILEQIPESVIEKYKQGKQDWGKCPY